MAVRPARLMDSRAGGATVDNRFSGTGRLGAGASINLTVLGRGGVPATGVTSVMLNVTGVGPSANTMLMAYPAGAGRPNTSNLNLAAGQTYPNAVAVKVGASGQVTLYNSVGTLDLVVDVVGYSTSPTSAIAPARLADTRPGSTTVDKIGAGAGALGVGGELDVTVLGRGGVPASGVDAVFVNVTLVQPTAATFLTAYPSGTVLPYASTVNAGPGEIVPNLALVKVGTNGRISVRNTNGSAHVIVDVMGWIPTGSNLVSVKPARIYDSRTASAPLTQQDTRKVPVSLRGGVPEGAAAAVVNVTGTNVAKDTFLTAYPGRQVVPNASTLNLAASDTRANLALVKLDATGAMTVYNDKGSAHTVIDVVGYVTGTPSADDTASMAITADNGQDDATAGTVFSSIGRSDAVWVAQLGDLSYNSGAGVEQAWCAYVKARLSQPMELLPGNHEAQDGDGVYSAYAACLPDRMGAAGDYGTGQYVIDDGPVRYIGISPNIVLPSGTRTYRAGTPEQAWLGARIDEAKAAGKWTVVGMHIPCLTIGQHPCSSDPALTDLLLAKKVDLVVAGHNHDYERTHQITGTVAAPVSVDTDRDFVAGEGTVAVVVGNGGHHPYALVKPVAGIWAAGKDGSSVGYLKLEANASKLAARLVNTAGQPYGDAFTITR